MAKVSIDFSGVFTQAAGATGLLLKEVKALDSKALRAHDSLIARPEMSDDGFFGLPKRSDLLNSSKKLAKKLKGTYENVVVLGIGGSALGFRAVAEALLGKDHNLCPKGKPKFFVMDYLEPNSIAKIFELAPAKKSIYVAISKSGKTQETAAHLAYFGSKLEREIGKRGLEDRVVIISELEGENPFQKIAERLRLRCLEIPPLVGGRFSVFSPVGLFPLALMGIDVDSLLRGAAKFNRLIENPEPEKNPALYYALIHYIYAQKGHNVTVFFLYDRSLESLGDWLVQLWAESLGKRFNRRQELVEVGLTPVRAIGPRDQHSILQLLVEGPFDKVITMIWAKEFLKDLKINMPTWQKKEFKYLSKKSFGEILLSEAQGTYLALTKSGKPTIKINPEIINAESLGYLMQFFMCATAYMAELWEINAFDQPGVQLGKDISKRLLGGS